MPDGEDTPLTTFAEMYGEDPPASILTPAQREYFFNERDVQDSGERALLRRIRRRIVAGFVDLSLLSRTLPIKEVEKIRSEDGPGHSLASFLYLLQPDNSAVIEDFTKGESPEDIDRRARSVEGDISRGIENVIHHRERINATVETSITVDRKQDLETLAEGDLSQLSRSELDTLLYTNTIEPEEYAEANQKRLERELG